MPPRKGEKGWRTTSRRFRKLRQEFKDQGATEQAPCWLCRQPIDYTMPHTDPYTNKANDEAWELDHLYPQSKRPDLAEDPGNFRHSHRLCNLRRSNKDPNAPIKNPSRNWLS